MEEKDINVAINFVEEKIEEWREIVKIYKAKSAYDEGLIKVIPYVEKKIAIYETIHQALLKEKPQKLERYADGYDEEGNEIYDMAVCPICRREFEVEYTEHCNYCPTCGQKLDWYEVEEREELNENE